MEQPAEQGGTCHEPFEKGTHLCRHCKLRTSGQPGLAHCSRMVAESPAMRTVLLRAAPMARAQAPIVILGETGTGKEVLARAIHVSSPRVNKPFVAVNCGAIPSELLESELFGHVRGAFSGAVADKVGLFEEADGGTLLLDEVAELPLALQVKLLRALQDGEIRRVGATRPTSLDVRILAATHRDLRAYVEKGLFREDLYFRLKVFTLALPPLRERTEDVLPLARHFLSLEKTRASDFTRRAQKAMLAYRWPGNIRELSNAVKHGAALAQGDSIDLGDLPDELAGGAAAAPAAPVATEASVLRPLADVERDHILAVLQACGGRQAEAARVLGIGRNTLWRKLRALGHHV